MRVDVQHYDGGIASTNVELNSLGEGIDFELIEVRDQRGGCRLYWRWYRSTSSHSQSEGRCGFSAEELPAQAPAG